MGDKVLMRNRNANKYDETYVCPYLITQLWTNANVTIRQDAVQERITLDGLNHITNNYQMQLRQ